MEVDFTQEMVLLREEVIRDLYGTVYEYSRFRQDANRGFS